MRKKFERMIFQAGEEWIKNKRQDKTLEEV
jgi:hypothetical protein